MNVIDTWELHYGLRVAFIGDDGAMVAAGHHDELRTVAAMNRFYRQFSGEPLDYGYNCYAEIAGSLSRRWARFISECDDPDHDQDCWQCSEIKQADWWMDYSAKEPGRGYLLPVTVWRP